MHEVCFGCFTVPCFRYADLSPQRHRPWRSGGEVRSVLWSRIKRVLQGQPKNWKYYISGKAGQRGKLKIRTCIQTTNILVFEKVFFPPFLTQKQDSIDVNISITDGKSKVSTFYKTLHWNHVAHLTCFNVARTWYITHAYGQLSLKSSSLLQTKVPLCKTQSLMLTPTCESVFE